MFKSPFFWLILLLLITLIFTAIAPTEAVLGGNARVVYLHGAWVWVALVGFLAAAAFGFVGLILRREEYHLASRALGRTALTFWIMFFPMSLYIMDANWGGMFFDEPRWRVPFTFAVTGLLLQLGLSLQKPAWASAANIAYAIALFAGMSGMQSILHPISPVFTSESILIKVFFTGLVLLLGLAGWQVHRIWFSVEKDSAGIM
ncbi:hypothetical protein EHM76_00895 [bacterium]|nr:MAG: hypothetical protein EHM76_00895 [bacterium]